MSDIYFKCPGCKNRLAIGQECAGLQVDCPHCSRLITVPPAARSRVLPLAAAGIVLAAIMVVGGVSVARLLVSSSPARSTNAGQAPLETNELPQQTNTLSPAVTWKAEGQVSALDNQIYEYIQTQGEAYERQFTIEKAEALVFIAASKEFKTTIVAVSRAFYHIQDRKSGQHFTDAEVDATSMLRFKDIGFAERSGLWYYDGQVVNMGIPLPIPEDMKPKQPDVNKTLEVTMNTAVTISDLKRLQVKGRTNLPDATEIMIILSCPERGYRASNPATVKNGEFESDWFRDKNSPAGRLRDGTYLLEVWTPSVSVLSDTVKALLGEKGRNMTGSLVEFDPIIGNQVNYHTQVRVQ